MRTVYLSGLHNGPNPSPGVGIARSLRCSENLKIIGVDYSVNSSGLHSSLLDDRITFPSWEDIDLSTWRSQIREMVSGHQSVYLSSLDLEVRIIAQAGYDPEIFLSPDMASLDWVRKPPTEVARALGFEVVPHLRFATDNVSEIESFIRNSTGGVWVKGEHYEAFRAANLKAATEAVRHVRETWGGSIHLEAHITGQEVGVAFVATNGHLIDCIEMEKAVLTPNGKTWAGRVTEVNPSLLEALASWVCDSGWHGGGELELIQTWAGDRYLMELNPRLPAWIHGATVTGRNLPAALVYGESRRSSSFGIGFTRVIEEIPLAPDLGAPRFPWSPDEHASAASKHPSGMPAISKRNIIAREADSYTANLQRKVEDVSNPVDAASVPGHTPKISISTQAFDLQVDRIENALVKLRPHLAYSVKTNPHSALVARAASRKMLVEVISQDEYNAARAVGVLPQQIILNGPAKWWPVPSEVGAYCIFVDSVPELSLIDELIDRKVPFHTDVLGLRLTRASMNSRFGIDVENREDFADGVRFLREKTQLLNSEWGLHFHYAQSVIGYKQWITDCVAVLRAADAVVTRLGRGPTVIDFGGGWHVNDVHLIEEALYSVFKETPDWVRAAPTRILELGKSLLEPCGRLFCRVIVGARRNGDIVVDAGVSDLPEGPFWQHPVRYIRDGRSAPLPHGTGRLLGRTCMEHDVLARDVDTTVLAVGDIVVFERVGGYDAAMRYPFGQGALTMQGVVSD